MLTIQTSIIGTIGPKTNNVDVLRNLMDAGLNIGEHLASILLLDHSSQSE